MSGYKIGYFVGSLAKGSINGRLAKPLVRLAPEDLEMVEIPFRNLPLYSYDHDADFPPAARPSRRRSRACMQFFVTPEYIQSFYSRSAQERHRLGEPSLWQ